MCASIKFMKSIFIVAVLLAGLLPIITRVDMTVSSATYAATAPALPVKEPNAVFAYSISGVKVTATLFDRLNKKPIDHLDVYTHLLNLHTPVQLDDDVSSLGNDAMQFSATTGKIYAIVQNYKYGMNEDLPYDIAIVETDFDFTEPRVVFSCNDCWTEQWIVHPSEPVLYVSISDKQKYDVVEAGFRNAKLVMVTLDKEQRPRVLTRFPRNAELRITPDGKTLFAYGITRNFSLCLRCLLEGYYFQLEEHEPNGALVTVSLADGRRTQTILQLPFTYSFGDNTYPRSTDASPDAREMAYHLGIVDVQTKNDEKIMQKSPYHVNSAFIGWSRDSSQMLFQMREKESDDLTEVLEVPIVYDRVTKNEWILPIQDAHLLDWSPAQTAILFWKKGEIGYYDLKKREWIYVAKGREGSWVTIPTLIPNPNK